MSQTKTSINHQFDKITKDFLRQIESLREVRPLVMILIVANAEKANRDFTAHLKRKGKEEKDEKGESYLKFSPEDAYNITALEKNSNVATASVEIIPQSLFVSLISQYDSFLGKFIREIFLVKPEILNSSEKNLTYSKLLELSSVEDAKEFIIEKEIESILRESHSDHFDWLENKLKMTLRKDLPIWQTFIELTERRNLFVHNDGVVSSQYLSICNKNKVSHKDNPKIGNELDVTPEYFETAFNCLYEIATKLTQVVWRKLIPADIEKADESLNDICFELIQYGQYDLANVLLDFATGIIPRHFNEETKNVFVINQSLSLKLGGNKEKSEDIIRSKDWSASSDKFKIAKEVLLDNFEEAAKLMKKIGPDGEVKKLSYKIWPLFAEFRKTKLFTDIFKEVFTEEFSLEERPKKLLEQLMQQVEDSKKQKESLNTSSFLEITKVTFPRYQFIPFKVDGFIKAILTIDSTFTTSQFKDAVQKQITTVTKFNEYLVSQSATQYLNPYTALRHCLYLFDKNKFSEILFEMQRESFEKWLMKNF